MDGSQRVGEPGKDVTRVCAERWNRARLDACEDRFLDGPASGGKGFKGCNVDLHSCIFGRRHLYLILRQNLFYDNQKRARGVNAAASQRGKSAWFTGVPH
jgi:hypothetical protein